jgi:hypothetical protein
MSGWHNRVFQYKQFDINWATMMAAAPFVNGNATFTFPDNKDSRNALFFDFEVSCTGKNRGRPCNGHVTLKHEYPNAHVTLLGWDGGRKTNYFFQINPNGTATGKSPPSGKKSDIEGTSLTLDQLPSELQTPIKQFLQVAFANCF